MIYIILLIILLILIIALFLATRLYKQEKKGRLDAENHNEILRRNMRVLHDYTKAVSEIKKKKIGIDKQIKGAVTDEEVDNIILDIIKSNNKRV